MDVCSSILVRCFNIKHNTIIIKNKNKMPPAFPIFQIDVDDKQVI